MMLSLETSSAFMPPMTGLSSRLSMSWSSCRDRAPLASQDLDRLAHRVDPSLNRLQSADGCHRYFGTSAYGPSLTFRLTSALIC